MIRLMVCSNEPLHSIGLQVLVRECEDIALVAVVPEVRDLVERVLSHRPDVILLTVDAGVNWGLLNTLRRDFPELHIVFWAHDVMPELAYQALESGIRGVLYKSLPPELIVKCIRAVSDGQLWFENGLTQTILNGRRVKVSRREGQLITLVSQGLKNKEIATVLSITEGTVKVYLSRLFNKVGAKDRFELALMGLRNAQPSPAGGGVESGSLRLTSMFITHDEAARATASQSGGFFRGKL